MFFLELSIGTLAISVIVLALVIWKIINWVKNLEWFVQQQFKISRELKDKVIDMEEK